MGHGSKWGTNAVSECIYVCYLRYDRQNAHHSNKDSDGRGGKINDLSRQTEIIFNVAGNKIVFTKYNNYAKIKNKALQVKQLIYINLSIFVTTGGTNNAQSEPSQSGFQKPVAGIIAGIMLAVTVGNSICRKTLH